MTQRIGVVSINPVPPPSDRPFQDFAQAFGLNTGNYMFTQAMYRQLEGSVEQIGFMYDPDRVNDSFDHVVIPAANWLGPNSNWDWLTDLIEKTEIPVTTIGIGLQAATEDIAQAQVSESAIRLAHVLSRKSALVSVRGDFTRDWFRSHGIENVVTTGCPSLYMRLDPRPHEAPAEGVVLQSTRYYMSQPFLGSADVNRRLYTAAGRLALPVVLQSECEELEYLIYRESAQLLKDGHRKRLLSQLYGLTDEEELFPFLDERMRVFFDVDEWAGYLTDSDGVLGTRLHGSIVALNAGVPAMLFPHDSRTGEVARFAAIPTLSQAPDWETISADQLSRLVGQTPVDEYLERRLHNGRVYRDFLAACGLTGREANLL